MSRSTNRPGGKKAFFAIFPLRRFGPIAFCCAIIVWLTCACAVERAEAGGQLELTVLDAETGKPVPCRIHLTGPRDNARKIPGAPFWHDHCAIPGKVLLKLPNGDYEFVIERGLEYLWRKGNFTIENHADDSHSVELRRFVDMSSYGWFSGDLDVRRPAADMELLIEADDLHVAEVITWQNDKHSWGKKPPAQPLVRFDGDRCYHLLAGALTRSGTEVLLLNSPTLPADPPGRDDRRPLMIFLLQARESADVWIDASRPYWWDLPVLAATGQIDSVQVAGGNIRRADTINHESGGRPRDRLRYPDPRGNARWAQHIYYQLLECGLRVPPSAGSGSGDSPNPIGYNRAYVHVDGEFTYEKWWEGLRAGRVVVTNGPLLRPSVNGKLPGHMFRAAEGAEFELEIGLTLSTCDPISYLEIVKNGQVEHSVSFDQYAKKGRLPSLKFTASGWFLVRAVTDRPDTYRFAMTGPYYVEIGGKRRISRSAVQFFIDWIGELAGRDEPADSPAKRETLEWRRQALDYWKKLLSRANAD